MLGARLVATVSQHRAELWRRPLQCLSGSGYNRRTVRPRWLWLFKLCSWNNKRLGEHEGPFLSWTPPREPTYVYTYIYIYSMYADKHIYIHVYVNIYVYICVYIIVL